MENRIKETIVSMNLRAKDVAETLGISPVGFSYLMRCTPKLDTIQRIADAIGVPAWKLLLTDEEIAEVAALHASLNKESDFNAPSWDAEVNYNA